jgi:hypothetical protein
VSGNHNIFIINESVTYHGVLLFLVARITIGFFPADFGLSLVSTAGAASQGDVWRVCSSREIGAVGSSLGAKRAALQ